MVHTKRHAMPKHWPVARKGTTFVVTPNHSPKKGVPILVVLRDMLKIAKNRKEVKKAMKDKSVLINNRPVRDEKNPALLYDTITLVPSKKAYRLVLALNGKFNLEEISEKEAHHKIAKVEDKKILKGKKIQINLSDGRNYISEGKSSVNDSVVVEFKDKKISKVLPLKEKANVLVVAGKHAGKKGSIEKIMKERKMVKVKSEYEDLNILIKQIMVIE